MLASVSGLQPVVHGYASQHSTAATRQPESELERKGDDKLKVEAAKVTDKATEKQSVEDLRKIQKLKSRDLEVKAHEQAHLSAAGGIAIGGASFTYTQGPNGVRYATGGEVSIDTSPVEGDPAATLRKADAIRRAALAPANPSSQDHAVAANASSMSVKARTDLIKLTQQQATETKKTDETETKDQVTNNDETETNDAIESVPSTGSLLDISV